MICMYDKTHCSRRVLLDPPVKLSIYFLSIYFLSTYFLSTYFLSIYFLFIYFLFTRLSHLFIRLFPELYQSAGRSDRP